jgi:predicted naringenin-chalcone synthase
MSDRTTPACYVQHISTSVPEKWLDKEHGADLLKQSCADPRTAKLLQRVARLTGIERRYLAALDYQFDGGEGDSLYRRPDRQPHGPGMGARTEAFHKSSAPLVRRAVDALPAESLARIDTLVTASCTHASAPGLEMPILLHTPVPASVDRWNLGFMGCSAGLAAMRLVHQTAALSRRALIVTCELSSLHFQYTDQIDQMTANLLFADGAAAMILSPEPSPIRIVACQCASLPEAAKQMIWFADDHGLRLELSQDLPETLAAHLPGVVSRFLQEHGTSIDAIDHWLAHPGGPQILEAVEKSLALPEDALALSWSVFRNYGNMSSPTIFFIMKELLKTQAHGQVVAMAFGPGLTIELVLLQADHNPR